MQTPKAPQSDAAVAGKQTREHVELVRWLIDDFQRRDLGQLPTEDWSRLQKELDHLAWKLVRGGPVFPVTWLKELESKDRGTQRKVTRGAGQVESRSEPLTFLAERQDRRKFRRHLPKLTREKIRQLQAQLRRVLGALRPVDDQFSRVRIRYPSIPGVIKRVHLMNDLSDESGRGIKRVYGADWRHLRWLAIATLLEEFGAQIARCEAPGCTQLFLRNRRQEYCSRSCSQKVRSSKWYEAHREMAQERRRQSYRREVRRKYPRAQVLVRKLPAPTNSKPLGIDKQSNREYLLRNTAIADIWHTGEGLSTRLSNRLRNAGLVTLFDLTQMTRARMLTITNFGQKSREELEGYMARVGVEFDEGGQ